MRRSPGDTPCRTAGLRRHLARQCELFIFHVCDLERRPAWADRASPPSFGVPRAKPSHLIANSDDETVDFAIMAGEEGVSVNYRY